MARGKRLNGAQLAERIDDVVRGYGYAVSWDHGRALFLVFGEIDEDGALLIGETADPHEAHKMTRAHFQRHCIGMRADE